MIYCTADLHFWHHNIIKYCSRPFADVVEMNEALIRNWQERVRAEDVVFVLGDVSARVSRSRLEALLARLPGTIHLVVGNHDYDKVRKQARWASVSERIEFADLVLSHRREDTGDGRLSLHGHSHGKLPPTKTAIDVGVDCFDFRPVTLDEIKKRLPGT